MWSEGALEVPIPVAVGFVGHFLDGTQADFCSITAEDAGGSILADAFFDPEGGELGLGVFVHE